MNRFKMPRLLADDGPAAHQDESKAYELKGYVKLLSVPTTEMRRPTIVSGYH